MNTNVIDFGAVADGRVCTKEIQAAIDMCAESGGGRVCIPAGTYVTGTLRLKSNIDLYLEMNARLLASPDLTDYNEEDEYEQNYSCEKEGWNAKHLIICVEQENVTISGYGTIDGNADEFFGPRRSSDIPYYWHMGIAGAKDSVNLRPGQMICFIESKNIRVENVSMVDSCCWNCFFHGCENIYVHGVTVKNKLWYLNTDGFDIDSCKNVCVSDCIIEVGDDAFAVRCSPKRLKHSDGVCENVVITNCIATSSACGIRIGVGYGLIKNIEFSNSIIKHSSDGIQFACNYNEFGCVNMENINISNIVGEKIVRPVTMFNSNGAYIKNVSLNDCSFVSICGIDMKCENNAEMERVFIDNCRFEITKDFDFGDTHFETPEEELGKSALIFENIKDLSVKNCYVKLPDGGAWKGKLTTIGCTKPEIENF